MKDFLQVNIRPVSMAVVVAIVFGIVAYNSYGGGDVPVGRHLTVSGMVRNGLFYAAVLGVIMVSRRKSAKKTD